MKKILIFAIFCSFFVTDAFSQGGEFTLYIEWDATSSNCSCPTGSTDSSFVINVYIRDVANEISVVNKSKTASISVDNAYVPITEVEDYCDLPNHEEIPVLYIQVTVSMLCSGSTPIVVCDDYEQQGPFGCDDFDETIEFYLDLY